MDAKGCPRSDQAGDKPRPGSLLAGRQRFAARTVALLLGAVCLFGMVRTLADTPPSGTFVFEKDSDGATADTGVSVTLTFTGGTVTFAAVGPGQNIRDSSTFTTHGSNISFNFRNIGKSASNQPYSLFQTVLTLPFKVFSDGPGTSQWVGAAVGAPGENPENPPGTNPPEPNPPGTNPPGNPPPSNPPGENPPGNPPPPPTNPNPPPPPSNPPRPPKPKTPSVADPFFNVPSPGFGGKDIVFGCAGTRWDTPDLPPADPKAPPPPPTYGCRPKNPHQPITCGTGCMITEPPRCKALNVQAFISAYNMAVFPDQKGVGAGAGILGMMLAAKSPGATPAEALIKQILGNFYNVFDKNVVVQMTNSKPDEDADLDQGFGGKYTLTVYTLSLQELSPAALVSTIGHEMVHLEQRQRRLPISTLKGEQGVKDSLFELEASSWQAGAHNFSWQIGSCKVASCVTKGEQLNDSALLACREWQAVNRLAALSPEAKQEMEKWLDQNPWTKQVWLPKHPDWTTLAPFASSVIKFNAAGLAGNQVDCNGVVGP